MYFRCVYSILQRYVFIYKFDQLVGERSAAVFNGRQGGLAGPVAPAAGHSGARGGAIPVAHPAAAASETNGRARERC